MVIHVGPLWPDKEGSGDREYYCNTVTIVSTANPLKATIGFTIKEVEEHGGSDVLSSGSFALVFAGPS
jgi:hypothetical protein